MCWSHPWGQIGAAHGWENSKRHRSNQGGWEVPAWHTTSLPCASCRLALPPGTLTLVLGLASRWQSMPSIQSWCEWSPERPPQTALYPSSDKKQQQGIFHLVSTWYDHLNQEFTHKSCTGTVVFQGSAANTAGCLWKGENWHFPMHSPPPLPAFPTPFLMPQVTRMRKPLSYIH